MEKGTPISSAFSYPWMMLLVAGGLAALIPFSLRWCHSSDPSVKAKSERSATESQVSASKPEGSRTQLPRNPQRLNDEEASEFLRGTVLEEVEIVDKNLEEAVAILRKEIRRAVPQGPVVGIAWSWRSTENLPRVKELRLKKVPLAVVIKYLCDATKCRYWIEDGSVVIEAWRWMNQEEVDHFMNDSRIERLEIADASLHEAISSLSDAVDRMKFRGRRVSIMVPRSGAHSRSVDAGTSGAAQTEAVRVRNLTLENVSVAEALREICKQTNTVYHVEEEQIFFQSIMGFPVR